MPFGLRLILAVAFLFPAVPGREMEACVLIAIRRCASLGILAKKPDERIRRELQATNGSWRTDETYVRLAGRWIYLYRAVDSTGATVDFLLSETDFLLSETRDLT